MLKHLVVTVSGHDQPGIVDNITKLLLQFEGNVEASRMARLGGEFAILMMVAVPERHFEALRGMVRQLREQDYKVTTRATDRGYSSRFAGWTPFQVHVTGADHEGIIHQVAHEMAAHGINIESMDTDVVKAPMSGASLFKMTAIVLVPPEISYQEWRQSVVLIGDQLGVDTEVSPYIG